MIDYDLKKIKALFFDVDGVLSAETIGMGCQWRPDAYGKHQRRICPALAVKAGLHIASLRR